MTISLGGGSLPSWETITLNSEQEATDFGYLMYNKFLGGQNSSVSRPFGKAILDGFVATC